jgi:hypothetical protein
LSYIFNLIKRVNPSHTIGTFNIAILGSVYINPTHSPAFLAGSRNTILKETILIGLKQILTTLRAL